MVKCKVCKAELSYSGGSTSSMLKHLTNKHPMCASSVKSVASTSTSGSAMGYFVRRDCHRLRNRVRLCQDWQLLCLSFYFRLPGYPTVTGIGYPVQKISVNARAYPTIHRLLKSLSGVTCYLYSPASARSVTSLTSSM